MSNSATVIAFPLPADGDGDDGDWVLMPAELTEAMAVAAAEAFKRYYATAVTPNFAEGLAEAYAAMVDVVGTPC